MITRGGGGGGGGGWLSIGIEAVPCRYNLQFVLKNTLCISINVIHVISFHPSLFHL